MAEKLEDTELHLSAEQDQTQKLGRMVTERDRQIRELTEEIAKLKRSAERAVAKQKQRALVPLDIEVGNTALNEMMVRTSRAGEGNPFSGRGDLNCSLSSGGGRRSGMGGTSEKSTKSNGVARLKGSTFDSPRSHKKSMSILGVTPRLTPMQDPFGASFQRDEVLTEGKGRKKIKQKTAQKPKTGFIGSLFSNFLKTE